MNRAEGWPAFSTEERILLTDSLQISSTASPLLDNTEDHLWTPTATVSLVFSVPVTPIRDLPSLQNHVSQPLEDNVFVYTHPDASTFWRTLTDTCSLIIYLFENNHRELFEKPPNNLFSQVNAALI
jgi:hypothetical protein